MYQNFLTMYQLSLRMYLEFKSSFQSKEQPLKIFKEINEPWIINIKVLVAHGLDVPNCFKNVSNFVKDVPNFVNNVPNYLYMYLGFQCLL